MFVNGHEHLTFKPQLLKIAESCTEPGHLDTTSLKLNNYSINYGITCKIIKHLKKDLHQQFKLYFSLSKNKH